MLTETCASISSIDVIKACKISTILALNVRSTIDFNVDNANAHGNGNGKGDGNGNKQRPSFVIGIGTGIGIGSPKRRRSPASSRPRAEPVT